MTDLSLTCCADVHELYSLIIDLWRKIACPEALVMIATIITSTTLLLICLIYVHSRFC